MARPIAGRCWGTCSSDSRVVVYQWKASKEKRLAEAWCPVCKSKLRPTCLGVMSPDRVAIRDKSEPHFGLTPPED